MSYAYGSGLNWSSNIDETAKKAFYAALGTHSPYGSPIPNELAVGKRWEDDKYVYQATPGNDKQPGFGAWAPASNSEKMGSTVGNDGTVFNPNGNFTDSDRKADPMLVWRTPKSSSGSSASTATEPKEKPDYFANAREASARSSAYLSGGGSFAGGFSPINVSGSPQDLYDSINASQNQHLSNAQGVRNRFLQSSLLSNAEIGGALRQGISELPDVKYLPKVPTFQEMLENAKTAFNAFG